MYPPGRKERPLYNFILATSLYIYTISISKGLETKHWRMCIYKDYRKMMQASTLSYQHQNPSQEAFSEGGGSLYLPHSKVTVNKRVMDYGRLRSGFLCSLLSTQAMLYVEQHMLQLKPGLHSNTCTNG